MSPISKFLLFFSVLITCAFLCGCSPSEDDFDPDTVATVGAIDAFGSVVVAGILWDNLDSANFSIKGQPGAEIDLQIGMTVQVEGRVSSNGSSLIAADVIYDPTLIGPVSSEAGAGDIKTLTIHGAAVEIDRFTAYDGTTFDILAVGRIYEVSGHIDEAGTVVASFVRDLGPEILGVSPVVIRGIVSDLDVGGAGVGFFSIGNITIDYSQALLEGIQALIDGVEVTVRGNLGATSDEVTATNISPAIVYPGEAAYFYLDGTLILDNNQWRIAGFPVDFPANTFYDPFDGVFSVGTRVWVCGYYRSGKVKAGWLRLLEPNVFVHAEVAATGDIYPSSFPRVEMLPVNVPGKVPPRVTMKNFVDFDTLLIDSRDGLDPFTLDDIAAGDHLLISAVGLAPGSIDPQGTRILRLERVLSVGSVFLTGEIYLPFFFGPGNDSFRVQGTKVFTDAFTSFTDSGGSSMTEFEFYLGLSSGQSLGKSVAVLDLADGDDSTIDVADSVQLLD